MPNHNEKTAPSVTEVIGQLGHCVELIPIDRQFQNISIGLYLKEGVYTVWTFSQNEEAQARIEAIAERMVALGGLSPVPGARTQLNFDCGELHEKPVKFLLAQAVGKSAEFAPGAEPLRIKDTKTNLWLSAGGREEQNRYVYRISGEGEAPNVAMRLRMVIAGFLKYGEMEKTGETEVAFSCGQRHDELLRLVLPYSRNISAVESMMEAEAERGQMTTSTLGFSPL